MLHNFKMLFSIFQLKSNMTGNYFKRLNDFVKILIQLNWIFMCLLVSFAIKITSKIMHAHLHIHNVPKRFSIFFEKSINHVTIHIKHLNIFPLKKTKRKINKLNSNLLLLQKNADTKKTTRIKTKQICSIYENKKQMTKISSNNQ